MASTLITRACNDDLLTAADKVAIDAELSLGEGNYKLTAHGVMGMAQEIIAGRIPSAIMGTYLTAAEQVDAQAVIDKIVAGDFTLDEVERLVLFGELGHYTPAQIEAILGL